MSWYRCPGCGPSQMCDVCGASECAQSFRDDCPGCVKAKAESEAGRVPWNMQWPAKGVRPWKHNRKWLGRSHRKMKRVLQENRRWAKAQGIDMDAIL